MKKLTWIPLFLFILSCFACAHSGVMSKPASYGFTIDTPEGWKKMDYDGYPIYTKENYFLQLIRIQNRPIDRPFRYSKKKILKDMLPEEAAQIIVDELISDQNLANLRILNNAPTAIKGNSGFKLLYSYKDSAGQAYKSLYYGFIKDDTFFVFRFTAKDRIYFQKDIGDFRSMMNTFQITKK